MSVGQSAMQDLGSSPRGVSGFDAGVGRRSDCVLCDGNVITIPSQKKAVHRRAQESHSLFWVSSTHDR